MPQIIVLQYALDPTSQQEQAFSSHAGAVRYAYNWALAKIEENWAERKTNPDTPYIDSSMIGLRKVWNQLAPWYGENSKEALTTSIRSTLIPREFLLPLARAIWTRIRNVISLPPVLGGSAYMSGPENSRGC